MLELSSIVLIVGSNPKPFGTGFVIHRDESASYILTCTHVIKDIENLTVNGRPATIVASDEAKFGFDLAVLKVEGQLGCSPLDVSPIAKAGRAFLAAGFSDQAGQYVLQQFRGALGQPTGLKSRRFGDGGGWQLHMGGEGKFEDGYSGSPVIDETTGRVLGVVAIRTDEASGKRGIAIALPALCDVWHLMPTNLLQNLQPSPSSKSAGPQEPVMNLTIEIEVFKRVLTRLDNQKSLIVVSGGSGMGKSHLLQLYRNITLDQGIDFQDFSLAPQITVQSCLSTLVNRLGSEHFQRYEEYLDSTTQASNANDNKIWYEALTRCFFRDLEDHAYMAPLVLFFDQYEKADQMFKNWLCSSFMPSIKPSNPLIVIVAGQGTTATLVKCHFFELTGLKKEHFYHYAKESKVAVDEKVIETLHSVLEGRPKLFVDFVNSYKAKPSNGSAQ